MEVGVYKTRLFRVITGAALFLASIFALQDFVFPARVKANISFQVGMGDLRRFEGEQAVLASGALVSSRSAVGMGDLRRFEGALVSSRSSVGMGDLRRFEGTHALQDTVSGSPTR
jgi:hypothetical protein